MSEPGKDTLTGFGLEGIVLLEIDTRGDALATWIYPSLPEGAEEALLLRFKQRAVNVESAESGAESDEGTFTFSKFRNMWFYTHERSIEEDEGGMGKSSEQKFFERVRRIGLCVSATIFEPEVYSSVAAKLLEIYVETKSIETLLQSYLALFSSGKNSEKDLDLTSIDTRHALLCGDFYFLGTRLGKNVSLLWSALLMKKKVFVFSTDLNALQLVVRTLPVLVWHRQDWSILRPLVSYPPTESEIEDIVNPMCGIAGFTDPRCKTRGEIFDICVDIDAGTLEIAEKARDDLIVGSYHTEIGNIVLEALEDGEESFNYQEMLMALSAKTKSLISNLDKLAKEDDNGEKWISFSDLMRRSLPRGMDRFIFATAAAEGFSIRL